MRRLIFRFTGQAASGGNPAGVPTHDFENEHLGRGSGHGGDVKTCFANGGGYILGHGAKARTAIGDRQVVIHSLGYMDGLNRVAHALGQLGNLQAGIGGITTAVVEEVTDVVRAEDFNQALVFGSIGFQAFELVAAGADLLGMQPGGFNHASG